MKIRLPVSGEMKISKGIRAKLFLLFILMGAFPLVVLVIAGSLTAVHEMENFAKDKSQLRNEIISQHVTELVEKNLVVLKSVAKSPNLIEYMKNPTAEGKAYVSEILHDTDEIFDDGNPTAIADISGQQLMRTDGATLVSFKGRPHFQETLEGRAFVTDIIASTSTGKMIVIIAAPIFSYDGEVLGMVQRNLDLVTLQNFISELDDDETTTVILDRQGRAVMNSDAPYKDFTAVDESYRTVAEKVYNRSGVTKLTVKGVYSVVSYSRNGRTGWTVLTVLPYHFIMDQAYQRAGKSLIFGLVMLLIGMLVAYLLTMHVTRPIIEIANVADEIASGATSTTELNISRNDELGKMVNAFNRMRSQRDTYQLDAELDGLTGLFNKKTAEYVCEMKIKTFNEHDVNRNILLAFYIIDLDHFKEVNDLLGHQFGDKVLIAFSEALRKIFRPSDCIGRFGGDEFVVMMDNLPNTEIILRKAKQINEIAFNLDVDGKTHFVTASIGIAIAPNDGRDYVSLFAAADKAVYYVKNHGKNSYHLASYLE